MPDTTANKPLSASVILEKVRRIPEVAYAIVQGKDGQAVGGGGYEAESLAGQAAYLAMVQSQLGAVFNAGEVTSAAVQGTTCHLLLFAAKNHYLSVLARSESPIGAVEAEVRKALVNR